MRIPLILCLLSLPVFAQQPSFDVASVKPGDPSSNSGHLHTDPGLVLFENVSLRTIIQFAYDIPQCQLSAPGWIDNAKFDINAKATDRTADDDTLKLMLRSLLAERFGMKIHREQKQLAVFELALGKNGPKLHEPAGGNSSKFVESKSDGEPVFSEDKTGLIVARATMAEIASKLSQPLKQPVVDKTGLRGRYDLRIDITPYLTPAAGDGDNGPRIADPVSFVVTAFQEQLGLKLEAGKQTVDLLVVDAINRTPSEN